MNKAAVLTPDTAKRIINFVRKNEIGGDRTQGGFAGKRPREAATQLMLVNVEMDGGAAGDQSTYCSFTYTVTDDSGNTLGTAVPIEAGSSPAGGNRIVAATMIEGSIGISFMDEGDLKLLWVNETFMQVTCNTPSDAPFGF